MSNGLISAIRGRKEFWIGLALLLALWLLDARGALTVGNDGGASNVTTVSAVMRGQVTGTNGVTNAVWSTFYYGTWDATTNLTNWSSSVFAGVYTNGADIATNVTGLTPATKYYYRLYGVESNAVTSVTAWASASTNFWTGAGAPTSTPAALPYVPLMVSTNGTIAAPANFLSANTIVTNLGLTALSNTLVTSYSAADTSLSNTLVTGYGTADTSLSNTLVTGYGAADTSLSNTLVTGYGTADTSLSNTLVTGYGAADTSLSNTLVTGYGTADTSLSNTLVTGYGTADTSLSNALVTGYGTADTSLSNTLVTGYGAADTSLSNTLASSIGTKAGTNVAWQYTAAPGASTNVLPAGGAYWLSYDGSYIYFGAANIGGTGTNWVRDIIGAGW